MNLKLEQQKKINKKNKTQNSIYPLRSENTYIMHVIE